MSARTPAVEPFCHHLLVVDLPALPPERRAATVAFAVDRAAGLPTPMRVGVGAVAAVVNVAGRVVGFGRVTRVLARRSLPVLGEYVRLLRSLSYAFVWETWPDTAPDGAPGSRERASLERANNQTVRRRRLCEPSGATCSSSARGPAARRRRRCSPRPATTCSSSRRATMVRQGEVVPFSLEQMDRQYRSGGVTAALGVPSIAYTEGCCAGGGTEINSGLYRRPPPEVLDALAHRARDRRLRRRRPVPHLRRGRGGAARADRARRSDAGERRAARRRRRASAGDHDEIPRWMRYPTGPTSHRPGARA